MQWAKGCVSGAVYWGDESLTKLLVKVRVFPAQIVTNDLETFSVSYSKQDNVVTSSVFLFYATRSVFLAEMPTLVST